MENQSLNREQTFLGVFLSHPAQPHALLSLDCRLISTAGCSCALLAALSKYKVLKESSRRGESIMVVLSDLARKK